MAVALPDVHSNGTQPRWSNIRYNDSREQTDTDLGELFNDSRITTLWGYSKVDSGRWNLATY